MEPQSSNPAAANEPAQTQTQTLRIFVSSPGDVDAERAKANQVVEQLHRWYGDAVQLHIVLWENLPLESDQAFQTGINLALLDIDIAVFILWSRLGAPVTIGDKDYASGTECEFELMLAALEESGGERTAGYPGLPARGRRFLPKIPHHPKSRRNPRVPGPKRGRQGFHAQPVLG